MTTPKVVAARFPYAGRSLAFVRTILGLPAEFVSAAAAREASNVHTQRRVGLGDQVTIEPPVGVVVWFAGGPHGDCGYSLGNGWVLGITRAGDVVIDRYDAWSSQCLGWSYTIGGAP